MTLDAIRLGFLLIGSLLRLPRRPSRYRRCLLRPAILPQQPQMLLHPPIPLCLQLHQPRLVLHLASLPAPHHQLPHTLTQLLGPPSRSLLDFLGRFHSLPLSSTHDHPPHSLTTQPIPAALPAVAHQSVPILSRASIADHYWMHPPLIDSLVARILLAGTGYQVRPEFVYDRALVGGEEGG